MMSISYLLVEGHGNDRDNCGLKQEMALERALRFKHFLIDRMYSASPRNILTLPLLKSLPKDLFRFDRLFRRDCYEVTDNLSIAVYLAYSFYISHFSGAQTGARSPYYAIFAYKMPVDELLALARVENILALTDRLSHAYMI